MFQKGLPMYSNVTMVYKSNVQPLKTKASVNLFSNKGLSHSMTVSGMFEAPQKPHLEFKIILQLQECILPRFKLTNEIFSHSL